jgi:hypothetical protein
MPFPWHQSSKGYREHSFLPIGTPSRDSLGHDSEKPSEKSHLWLLDKPLSHLERMDARRSGEAKPDRVHNFASTVNAKIDFDINQDCDRIAMCG